MHKDFELLSESEEYLKRTYKSEEYEKKIKLLTEYYKFHKDIPRLFMKGEIDIVNKYYDEKRKIEYYKIVRIIE